MTLTAKEAQRGFMRAKGLVYIVSMYQSKDMLYPMNLIVSVAMREVDNVGRTEDGVY